MDIIAIQKKKKGEKNETTREESVGGSAAGLTKLAAAGAPSFFLPRPTTTDYLCSTTPVLTELHTSIVSDQEKSPCPSLRPGEKKHNRVQASATRYTSWLIAARRIPSRYIRRAHRHQPRAYIPPKEPT